MTPKHTISHFRQKVVKSVYPLTSTKAHERKSIQHPPNRPLLHIRAKHKLMRHQLHQSSINQYPSTDRIEDPVNNQRRLRFRRVRPPDPETDGNSDGCREAISHSEDIRGPAFRFRPGDGSEAGAEGETFEHLVENEDYVEGCEFFAGDGESETDEDGVEYYAEFEDEYARHLCGVVFGD